MSRFARLLQQVCPPEIVKLIEHPVPVNIWLPETNWVGLCMAHADEHFANDEQGFYDDERKRVDVLFNSPLYRVFFLVGSPKMLIKFILGCWGRRNWSSICVFRPIFFQKCF
ncbi:MAG: hypothetical protein GY822_13985 [Deltaproteobacteria bacterium]|nr:hypothetical protein [Deltaproteobacteria bacterium]